MNPTITAADVAIGQSLPELRIDVTPRTVVMGASASRDWQPQHHDYRHCTEVANLPDIFLNTPHQAGFIERYVTDWAGAYARLGALQFRMRKTVVPGDTLVFHGTVAAIDTDEAGTTWVDLDLRLTVDDATVTECQARVAVPADAGDNPWGRRGSAWTPTALPGPDRT